MTNIGHVAVIDIGKTNAKLALVDLDQDREIDAATMPNQVIRSGNYYPHYDIDAIWRFLLDNLAGFQSRHSVDAISVTTHGATAALVTDDGQLALPVLDYEHDGPDVFRDEYDMLRPEFSETGSPRLPVGLNLAAQIYWQQKNFPAEFEQTATIMMYPQYWGFRLTGIRVNEVTSLGCHTDLWAPHRRDYSSLVEQQEWRSRFASLMRADEKLGHLSNSIAAKTDMPIETPVYTGIHDSNASLLPHLIARAAPFSVVSTGTWVISMAIGGEAGELDPHRDTLINVNAFGDPVPSARFMGGREYEKLTALCEGDAPTKADVQSVLTSGTMILPSIELGCGPFPDRQGQIFGGEGTVGGTQFVAASFYLANMTATCLEMIGARGETIVEGPFSKNAIFLEMLAVITGRPVCVASGSTTGTSIGAAMLCGGTMPSVRYDSVAMPENPDQWRAYAKRWRDETGRG